MNIYVGNLAFSVSEDQLRSAFSQFGKVSKASVIMDRVNNRSKGFGFVEMDDATLAKPAKIVSGAAKKTAAAKKGAAKKTAAKKA